MKYTLLTRARMLRALWDLLNLAEKSGLGEAITDVSVKELYVTPDDKTQTLFEGIAEFCAMANGQYELECMTHGHKNINL